MICMMYVMISVITIMIQIPPIKVNYMYMNDDIFSFFPGEAKSYHQAVSFLVLD